MHKLITNCPNCAAPLSSDGYCNYCNTKVRYANELEINCIDKYTTESMELLLKIRNGDTTLLLPLYGKINNVNITCDSQDYFNYRENIVRRTYSKKEVNFDFTGILKN